MIDYRIDYILGHFDKHELRKLLKVDWKRSIREAKLLSKRINGCENCQKVITLYIFQLTYGYRGPRIKYKYFASFCSVRCFNIWRVSGKELFKLRYNKNNVYEKLQGELAHTYSLHILRELSAMNDIEFYRAVKNKLKTYENDKLCNYCHHHKKAGYSFLMCNKDNDDKQGNYCSKKCMVRGFQQQSVTL